MYYAERAYEGKAPSYLSKQALEILVAFKTCLGASLYLHPGRYETALPVGWATMNRVIDSTEKLIRECGDELESFVVYDSHRTGSTLLHEADVRPHYVAAVVRAASSGKVSRLCTM